MTDRIELGLKDANAGCACCAVPSNTETSAPVDAAVTAEVLVNGMTCSHCASSVTEELGAVEGVESVTVDLNAGGTSRVTIHSTTPVDPAAVKSAVEEAGYALATSQP
ncbi:MULTISPECIES: heavy-metal-associated domain-containing protein [Microbacterium]|uniref:heavy-metal-associated domain-containing protein n=1 Tax=Microbacterium TaxID=33882 RepID=UPI000733F512|nr:MULTISPECIES: cation transporter [Microbacterium]KTR77376.1 heavy metal transporter [Microbacterium oxydans]MBC6496387.1 heavy metal transporter [Microbacterium sp. 4-7]MBE7956222.1 heavy-metal-associated domain-containing protein [Microbacterium sp. R1]MBP5800616.1 heavy-metal-associated domain-containing protein [Microbacterium liquefaciens]MCE0508926.1 cation transporter [Microbacterium sp. KKR3/1]